MKSRKDRATSAMLVIRVALLALCAIVAGGGRGAFGESATTPLINRPDSVYVKMDYMRLVDSTPQEYFELELGEWRPIQAQRIRQGVTTAWHFYEMMPGARKDDDEPYDYITISVFDDYEKVFDQAGVQAIFQVYPEVTLEELYDRADGARSFVRSDLWKLERVTSPDTASKPSSPYLLLNFYEAGDEAGSKHRDRAVALWPHVHAERIRKGALNGAALLSLRNPEGEHRPYAYLSIEYFDTLTAMQDPVTLDCVRAAHPDMTAQEAEAVLRDFRGRPAPYKSQLWRLIDAIEPDSAAAPEDETE